VTVTTSAAGANPPAGGAGMMPAEEAAQVIWQGRPTEPREPMGQMLERGQLTIGDLQWAATRRFNPRVKAAARTLLAQMGRPVISPPGGRAGQAEVVVRPGGPAVRRGSRFLEDQEFASTAYAFAGLGGGFASLLWAAAVWFGGALTWPQLAAFLFLVLCTAGVGLWSFWRYSRRLFSYARGRRGEDEVVEGLREVLDRRWVIFRNLHLPERKDDIDVVLVGPGGIWAVEVKAFRPTVRIGKDGRWEWQARTGWLAMREQPGNQAQGNAKRLRAFLQRAGIDVR
jgi:hypothetical protein